MNRTKPAPAPQSAAGSNPRLAEAVEAYRALLKGGSAAERAAFRAEHADLGPALAECLDALDFLEAASPGLRAEAVGGPNAIPAALGDFRIVREIGRGGMGLVYEAEQLSLDRRVALKVLPFAATMDPRQLQRFHNEARAAASLHHEHIVPVYAVGCERAVHYYAMQLIEGQTLAELIERQRGGPPSQGLAGDEPEAPATSAPTASPAAQATSVSPRDAAYFRRVAGWGIQAAEALECAHTLGIVHRDIKPANLILDDWGKLWVTDFGLARTATDAGLTVSGDLVGTLRYMSPEQALASHGLVDHRTDIYSLGATLYELLTGRPAVEGQDRRAILKQIADEEPPPPHTLNREVPIELETIVFKSLAKEPAERYATAQELADDLRSWLEDRPIRARQPTLAKRLTKWARRHKPVVAVGFGVAAAALVVLLLGLLWHNAQLGEAAERERNLRADAEARREDAIAKRNMARRVVDKMYTQVATRLLEQEPRQSQLQREFLEEALRFYQELAQDVGDDPASQFDVAVAHRRLARLNRALGKRQESEQEFAKANAMLERLAEQSPERSEYRRELATSCSDLGLLLMDMIRADEAERVTRKAIGINEQLLAESPDDPALRQHLADSYNNLGIMLAGWRGGRALPREAEEAFRQALRRYEKLVEAFPKKADYRHTLGAALSNLAALLMFQGHSREARQLVERAVEEQEAARKLNPRDPSYRLFLSNHLAILADLLDASGEAEEAVKVARRTVEVLEKLAADWPDVPEYRRNLANNYSRLAIRLTDRNPQEAESVVLLAVPIMEQLLRDDPKNPMYREILANVQLNLGHARYRAGDWPGALAALQQSLEVWADGSTSCYLFLAMTHWRLGHKKEAQDWFDKAVARMGKNNLQDAGLKRLRAEADALLSGKQVPQSLPEPVK
jgi:serine/threonine protein kinase